MEKGTFKNIDVINICLTYNSINYKLTLAI